MHIKRLLSGSLAALMVASSFNVPVVNAAAIDEPTEVVEEANDALGDDDIIVDDASEEETEETTEVSEPEETPAVEEEAPEEAAPEVVVEEAGEQEVVGAGREAKTVTLTVAYKLDESTAYTDGVTSENTTKSVTWEASGEIATYDPQSATVTLPAAPTKDGYTFAGWKVNDTTTVLAKNALAYTLENITEDTNVTLTATWTVNKITVTYQVGETLDSEKDFTEEHTYAEPGTFAGIMFAPPAENKGFVKWVVDSDPSNTYEVGQPINAGDAINKDLAKTGDVTIVLKPVWANVQTVHFVPNAPQGVVAKGNMGSSAVVSGTKLPKCGFTVNGYEFKGWFKANDNSNIPRVWDGSLPLIADEAEYEVAEGALPQQTLYAVWTEANPNPTVTITFKANNGTSLGTQTVSKNKAVKLQNITTTKAGFTLDGWTDSNDEKAEKLYSLKETVKLSEDITLYPYWVDGKTLETGLTLTSDIENDKLPYTGAAINAKFAVKDGTKDVTIGEVTYKKYNVANGTLSAAKSDKDNTHWTDSDDGVGIYKATFAITAAPDVKGEDVTVFFEVVKPTLSEKNIKLSGTTDYPASEDAEDTFYLMYAATASDDVKAGDPIEVKPKVDLVGLTGLKTEQSNVDENDYKVSYSNNKATGTATVTVEFLKENSTFGIKKNQKITKNFSIVDYDYKDNEVDWELSTGIVKATAEKEGTISGVVTLTHKKVTKSIPKIDKSKSTLVGSLRQEDFEGTTGPKIDALYDTTGKELKVDVTYKYIVTDENKGVVKVTLGNTGADADRYEGSFELDPIEFKECDEHEFEDVIIPGTTKKEGSIVKKCKNCGAIEGTAKTIRKLDEASVNFNIKNDPNEDGTALSAIGTKPITFIGKDITIDGISVSNVNTVTEPEADKTKTYNKGAKTTYSQYDSNNKDNGFFEVSYKNNDKATKKCEVTITFTNKVPEYAGSSITKEFEIKESGEEVKLPIVNTYKEYHYGDEIVLESETEGAKIWYAIDDETFGNTLIDGNKKIKSDEAIAYKNAIKLDPSMYSTTSKPTGKDYRIDTIKLIVVAQKGNGTPVERTYPLTVVNAKDDWGDVKQDGSDRSFGDATEIPEGIWISNYTLNDIQDDASYYYDGDLYPLYTTYTGRPKTLPTKKINQIYNPGSSDDPTEDYRVFFHNKLLNYGTDYTVSYKNNVNAWPTATNNSLAKAPTIIITGKGQFAGSFTQTFDIDPADISEFDPYDISPYMYKSDTDTTTADITVAETDKIQTPAFKLENGFYVNGTYKKVKLSAKDFTVDYSKVEARANTDAKPRYEITINGTGNYTGEVSRYLKVTNAGRLINKGTVSFDTSDVIFNGENQINNVRATVKLGNLELVQGKDFDVKCSYLGLPTYNYKTDSGYKNYYDKSTWLYTAGKYTLTVVGKGDFSGSLSKTVTITNKNQANIKNVEVALPSDTLTLDTSASPYKAVFGNNTITVKDGGNILEEGNDYLLLYKANRKAGTAKLNVVGIGKYTGTKVVNFTIPCEKLTAGNIQLEGKTEFVYTGGSQYQGFKVVVVENNQPKTLEFDKDYTVVLPKDAVNVGKKTITVKGINNYKGSVAVKYEIKKFDISSLTGTAADNSGYKVFLKVKEKDSVVDQDYTGTKIQPVMWIPRQLFDTAAKNNSWMNQNFSFAYKNGFKAESDVTVTITGKKNFTGKVVGTYHIKKAKIDTVAKATITDVQSAKKFKAPTLNVFNNITNGKLAKNKDYTVEWRYNATTDKHGRYDKVDEKEATTAGTEYIARVVGMGGYEGYKDFVFRVVDTKMDLSKATVKVNGTYIFNNKDVKLNKDDISVSIGGVAVPSENFEIVSYTNNDKVGTAKVKIHGIVANDLKYGGYKEATFKIQKRSMNYILQFKADKKSTDDKQLTIGGKTANITKKDNSVFTVPKSGFTASTGTGKNKVNYVLSYYYDENGKQYLPGDVYNPEVEPGTISTLTAKFEKAPTGTYAITFKGGTGAEGKAPADIKAKRGNVYKLPSKGSLKKANFVFLGWTNGTKDADGFDVIYAPGTTVCNLDTAKATFTAYWTDQYYNIKYNYDKGSAPALANPSYYTKANAATLAFTNEPTRNGYTFIGWTDGTKGTTASKAYKIPADKVGKTITLKANWKPNTYTIAFNANGAAGATAPSNIANQKVGEVVTLPDVITTTDTQIAKFEGWAKDAKAVKADYKAKAKVKDILANEGETITLYAIWTPIQYKITWDVNGGTLTKAGVKTYTAKTASTVTLANGFPEVTRAKRTLVGWKINGTGNVVQDLSSLATTPDNVTLVADWGTADITASHKIKYVTGDSGITIADKDVILGDTVTLDTLNVDAAKEKTKDKYLFSYWTDAEGKKYGNGASFTMPANATDDVTLTAQWAPKAYAIHYNTNSGTFLEKKDDEDNDIIIPRTYKYGVGATLPGEARISYVGHKFDGWYDVNDTEFKSKIDSVSTTAAEDLNLVAKWTGYKLVATYSVTGSDIVWAESNKDKAIANTIYQFSPAQGVTNATSLASDADFSRPGYTFGGWKISDDATDEVQTLDKLVKAMSVEKANKNVTLVPIWKAKTYKVSYNLDGGKLAKNAKNPEKYEFGGTIENELAVPTKANYSTSAKWVQVESASADIPDKDVVVVTKDNLSTLVPKSGDTIYLRADYGKIDNTVEITFVGGEGATGTMAVQKAYKGDKINANTFTKTGHTFKEWKVSGSLSGTRTDGAVLTNEAVSDNAKVTLTADWTLNTTTIKYNGNGADSGTTGDTTYTAIATAAPNLATNGFTKAHHTFKEWNTQRNGKGKTFKAGDAATDAMFTPNKAAKTVTLYAIWKEDKNVTVTYNANGGTGTMENTTLYKAADQLAKNTFTKKGYSFEGWSVAATKATDEVLKADEASGVYDLKDTDESKKITLYAQWKAVEYTITYDVTGGTNAATNPAKYTVEDEITLADATIDEAAKEFKGWVVGTKASEASEVVYAANDTAQKNVKIAKGSIGNKYFKAVFVNKD